VISAKCWSLGVPSVRPTLFDTLATSAQDLVDRMIRVSAFAILTALTLGVAAHGATKALIKGTAQSDDIQGTQGGDFIYGFVGNDEIDGRGGSDVIFGGPGDDTLSGGGGKDYLAGKEGDDTLSAAYGEGHPVDFLSCGAGDDLVILADVPEVDRGSVRRLLDGAPSRCESMRFTR
jgi:Ca2+-binding RTX toxin-like protein